MLDFDKDYGGNDDQNNRATANINQWNEPTGQDRFQALFQPRSECDELIIDEIGNGAHHISKVGYAKHDEDEAEHFALRVCVCD